MTTETPQARLLAHWRWDADTWDQCVPASQRPHQVASTLRRCADELAALDQPAAPTPKYWIEAKDDGTWLIIKGEKASAMIRLEAVTVTLKAVAELRESLLAALDQPAAPRKPWCQICGVALGGFYCEVCRAALDQTAPQEPSLWQPIKTAPKDGTWIRLRWEGTTVEAIGHFMDGNPWWPRWRDWRDVVGNDVLTSPTHWMPLPAPPVVPPPERKD